MRESLRRITPQSCFSTPARGSQVHGIHSYVYARPWPFFYSYAEENNLLSCLWAITFSTGVGSTEVIFKLLRPI